MVIRKGIQIEGKQSVCKVSCNGDSLEAERSKVGIELLPIEIQVPGEKNQCVLALSGNLQQSLHPVFGGKHLQVALNAEQADELGELGFANMGQAIIHDKSDASLLSRTPFHISFLIVKNATNLTP